MAILDITLNNLIYVEAAIIVLGAVILERVIVQYLKQVAKRTRWPPHITNGFVLFFRLLILLGAAVIVLRVGGVPPDWLAAYAALGGAAVGFASQRTLGNFFAGFFIIATHPFRVNDYIKVDNLEGIVDEITFNYTKILTRSSTLVYISNLKILDQNVVNYQYLEKSSLYCYNFELAFDQTLSTAQLEKILEDVFGKHSKNLPRKPEYTQLRMGAFERTYGFYIYVTKPQDIFTIHPALVKEITEAWEKTKAKTSNQ